MNISMYQHVTGDQDVKIYSDAVRCREEDNTLHEATRRVLNGYSPPFAPEEVRAIVDEAFRA